tara:strand:- start:1451 stop:1846 length:396 start_codon:yes stop_codon:yes gene_type:complete
MFIYKKTIKEHHLDFMGHVNNAVYLTILEEARWEFLKNQNYTMQDIKDTGIAPIILECNIKFIKELILRQEIIIKSQVTSFDGKIGIMQQNIFNENDVLCSSAKFTFGFFDVKARKLITSDETLKNIIDII